MRNAVECSRNVLSKTDMADCKGESYDGKEKMLAGQLYNPGDKELSEMRLKARKLARRYNSTDEDHIEELQTILNELVPNRGKDTFSRRLSILTMAALPRLGKGAGRILTLWRWTAVSSQSEITCFLGQTVHWRRRCIRSAHRRGTDISSTQNPL